MAEIGGADSAATAAGYRENEKELKRQRTRDVEQARIAGTDTKDGITNVDQQDRNSSSSGSDLAKDLSGSRAYSKGVTSKVAVVHGLNRPLFHIDLTSALQSAVTNVEHRGEGGVVKGIGT